MITVHAFKWVPPLAQGLTRDLRIRWALEEAGLAYRIRPIVPADQRSAAYLALQPFGQAPVYEEDGLVLFESGAIVHHIGTRSAALLPTDPAARARAVTWLFAALNSVEIVIQQLAEIDLFFADQEWVKQRRPMVEQFVRRRLADLAARLGDKPYLDDAFTVGDLMMTTVLQILRHTDLVAEQPKLKAYQLRCEARPAHQRAYRDHMAAFAA